MVTETNTDGGFVGSRQAIKDRFARKPEAVTLQSGVWYFRRWHGTERDIWEEAVDANKIDDQIVSMKGLKALAVVLSVCDAAGSMIYQQSTPEERAASIIEVNADLPPNVIDEIYRVAIGRYVGKVIDEKKDSGPEQT